MRGEGGVAGEGRVVGLPKFHSWGKCTMPRISTQIGCQTLSLACVLTYIIYVGPLFRILGCNYAGPLSCILGCIIILRGSFISHLGV